MAVRVPARAGGDAEQKQETAPGRRSQAMGGAYERVGGSSRDVIIGANEPMWKTGMRVRGMSTEPVDEVRYQARAWVTGIEPEVLVDRPSTMPSNNFKVYDGAGAERLGAAVLADDDEAIAFAKRVMTALMHRDADLYTTGKMEITAGKRSLATLPFESGRDAGTVFNASPDLPQVACARSV